MRETKHRNAMIAGFTLALSIAAPVVAQNVDSSMGNYEAYVEPMYDVYGNKVGIEVHYSLGVLYDEPGDPPHYSAVCMLDEGWGGTPCVSHDDNVRGWTRNTPYSAYTGYWMSREIPMNCNSSTKARVQVHQPYIYSGSELEFHLFGDTPYNNDGDLFYSGSSESAKINVQGCEQVN